MVLACWMSSVVVVVHGTGMQVVQGCSGSAWYWHTKFPGSKHSSSLSLFKLLFSFFQFSVFFNL